MDLNLQPIARSCLISSRTFEDGDRVASFLLEVADRPEVLREDVLESQLEAHSPGGKIVCRWVQVYKSRRPGDNAERSLKLTTESLFLTLADPATEPSEENTRLLVFLALMLERKKVLRPRGRTADGLRKRFEHARSKQVFELPAVELDADFFIQVQEQLSVLVGSPKPKVQEVPAPSPQEQAPESKANAT